MYMYMYMYLFRNIKGFDGVYDKYEVWYMHSNWTTPPKPPELNTCKCEIALADVQYNSLLDVGKDTGTLSGSEEIMWIVFDLAIVQRN